MQWMRWGLGWADGVWCGGRVTYAIVALPIALVTSWVLWERGTLAFAHSYDGRGEGADGWGALVVLGKERKRLGGHPPSRDGRAEVAGEGRG